MYKFHTQRRKYFKWQYLTTKDYIIPFLGETHEVKPGNRILEIGCAEGGVLKAFREIGCNCVGIELSPSRYEKACELHGELDLSGPVEFINRNVYDIDPKTDFTSLFDIIILKDVIEHIPDQERFIDVLKGFLNPGGVVFFGFPPWRMPYGGHQQIAANPVLRVMPYYHLLPKPMYIGMLKMSKDDPKRIEDLSEIVDTRLSIRRFEKIIDESVFKVVNRKFWLFNPIYQYKFGVRPRGQNSVVGSIPYFRDFVTTAAYYTVELT